MTNFVKKYLIFIILIFSSQLFAVVTDPFSIFSFKTTKRVFTFKGNDIIKSESGKNCIELDSLNQIQPGELILRKKYEPADYRIYKGTLDTAAFNREPPFYAFDIPSNIPLEQFLKKRIYSKETENQAEDIGEVYFDSFHFYARHFSRLFYFDQGAWGFIEGKRKYPSGTIEVVSDPPEAQLIINGISSLKKTPCTLTKLPSGYYTIELFLPHYHFTRKDVIVSSDSTVKVSFQLMNDFDTVYISGTTPYGILMLPQPPTDTLFRIDTMATADSKLNLLPGTYRVRWNGGEQYASVDTTLKVVEGKISYFDYIFQRRKGMLKISTIPFDAEVCIEKVPCGFGDKIIQLPSGNYQINVQHHGFQNVRTTIYVFPDTVTEVRIDLRMNSDRDADGFVDTVDKCPDEYGIYDGCPRRSFSQALAVKKDEVMQFVKNDHFEAGFSMIGFISKIPANRSFADFLSTFSSGRFGGINNYRGLTMLNTFHLMYHGLYGSIELGQWSSGIRYKRNDTLHLSGNDKEYIIYYDSINDVKPVIYLPSTAVSIGFHYNWSWVNVIYSIGFQWEDIIVNQILDTSEKTFNNVVFDNDWLYHQIHFEADFHVDTRFVPSVYFNIKFPFGMIKRTRWHVLQAGFQMKLYPLQFRGARKNGP